MKHGGKRKGAGRKPVPDKKIQVTIGIKESEIEKLGGEAQVKNKIKEFVKNEQTRTRKDNHGS